MDEKPNDEAPTPDAAVRPETEAPATDEQAAPEQTTGPARETIQPAEPERDHSGPIGA